MGHGMTASNDGAWQKTPLFIVIPPNGLHEVVEKNSPEKSPFTKHVNVYRTEAK